MSLLVKVSYFHVRVGFDGEDIAGSILKGVAKNAAAVVAAKEAVSEGYSVSHEPVNYTITDVRWDEKVGVLTGVMWKERCRNLPSRMRAGKPSILNIGKDNLGEGAAFAWNPSTKVVAIEYNHTGPRHGVFALFIGKTYDKPVCLSPVTTPDVLKRMADAKLLRKLEFRIDGGDAGIPDLMKEAPKTVRSTVEAMQDSEGYGIKVGISMGHYKGGLGEKALALVKTLANWGGPVTTLKVGVDERDGLGLRILDMMGGQLKEEFSAPEKDRTVDHLTFANQLRAAVQQFKVQE